MESSIRRTATVTNNRSHRGRFRITKISTAWPVSPPPPTTTTTTGTGPPSSSAPHLPRSHNPIPIFPSPRTPRRKRISASWLGNSAYEPAWKYGHLRYREEQERWERETKDIQKESWTRRGFEAFLTLLKIALIHGVAGWAWVAGILGLGAVVVAAVTGWVVWEYVAWSWRSWWEDGREGGEVNMARFWRRLVSSGKVLGDILDLMRGLGVVIYLQLRESTPGVLVRKMLGIFGAGAALGGMKANLSRKKFLELRLVGHAGTRKGDALSTRPVIASAALEIPGKWQESFSWSPGFAKYRFARTDCDDGFRSPRAESVRPDNNSRELVKRLRKTIHDADFKVSPIARSPLSASDAWSMQEQEVGAGAMNEPQLENRTSKSSRSEQINWKPYWSRSLEKPVYSRIDRELTGGSNLPNTSVAVTSSLAITPRTPAVQVQTPHFNIQEELPQPLGNVAMLQRWLSKVSDLCQACDALWHLHRSTMLDFEHSRITLQQVKLECETVRHLDVRVAWNVLPKRSNDTLETELLVGIQQLKDLRERQTLVDSDDEILYGALTLMKTLLSRVKDPEHRRSKGKRKTRPSTIISDGWSLSQVQLVHREVRQLAQSRLQILDSVYLLGQAYPDEKLVAEYQKLECQLWPLLAQAKLLGLGSRHEQLQEAIEEVEDVVYSQVGALQRDLERAEITRSMNEDAAMIAQDTLQDSTMTGLSPTTPKLAFGHAVASDDDIDALKDYIFGAARQLEAIVLLEDADRIRSAGQIEEEIREYLSKLSKVVDYSNEHVRQQIDEIFDIADERLLVLRDIRTMNIALPVDGGLYSARSPPNDNFSPIRQSSEPPTPAQLIPAKERRTEQPSDYPAKRALWQQEYTERMGARNAEVALLWPFHFESFNGDRLTLNNLHSELQSTVEDLKWWRTSFERLTSVYDRNGSTSNRNATHMGQANLRNGTGIAGVGRSAARVWPSAADLVQDGSINHQILLPPLAKLNNIRGKVETMLLMINLERRKIERDNTAAQELTQYPDLERTAIQTLDYVFQCLLDLGERSSQLDQTKVTFEQAQLYASVACWVAVRQGSFLGRCNNLAQLEDAQKNLETKFDAVKTKACGQVVPAELRNMALILDQLEYHSAGTDRLAEVFTAPLGAAGIREVRERTKKLQEGLRTAYTWMRERHNQHWFLDGPPDAIANLRDWVRAGKVPSAPHDRGHLCGARALLMSLQTCLRAQDGLMFDARIPGPEDAGELLRKMFVDVDDTLALVPVPTRSPGNLAEPSPEYAAFVYSRLSSIEDEHGIDSDIYRRHWDEARAINDWTPRQLQIAFDFLAEGHVFELPAVDLRLGVVIRDADDSHNQTTATAEFFGEEDEVKTSTVLWLYYDNAAKLSEGAISHWQGFSSPAEANEQANAVVNSWFNGTRLPRPAGSVRPERGFALQPPPPARGRGGRGSESARGGRGDRGQRGSLAGRGGREARASGRDGPESPHTDLRVAGAREDQLSAKILERALVVAQRGVREGVSKLLNVARKLLRGKKSAQERVREVEGLEEARAKCAVRKEEEEEAIMMEEKHEQILLQPLSMPVEIQNALREEAETIPIAGEVKIVILAAEEKRQRYLVVAEEDRPVLPPEEDGPRLEAASRQILSSWPPGANRKESGKAMREPRITARIRTSWRSQQSQGLVAVEDILIWMYDMFKVDAPLKLDVGLLEHI
ncbi:hypothetical protein BST61_g9349 [Cercospora zeina]